MRFNFLSFFCLALIAFCLGKEPLLAKVSGEVPLEPEERELYQSLRLGIMLQGQGEALYSWFGHAGFVLSGPQAKLRELGQLHRKDFAAAASYTGEALLFDYGNFDATGKYFVFRFLAGELNYYKNYKNFQRYAAYNASHEKRGIEVYWLNLDWKEKAALVQILFRETNVENRLYKYDFYFDNCLTRIRDQLDEVFDGRLQAQILGQSPWTVRQILRQEIGDKFWGLLLVEFLQGAKIDQSYSRWDSIFFPTHMPKLLQELVIPGRNEALLAERETIFPFRPGQEDFRTRTNRIFQRNLYYLWFYCIGLLAFAYFFWRKEHILPNLPHLPVQAQRDLQLLGGGACDKGRAKRKRGLYVQRSYTVLRFSYFALCLLVGNGIAIFSAVLWLLTILQSFDVALQNAGFFLGTPFLLLQGIVLLLFLWKSQRRRLSYIWLWLWRIHALSAALLLPVSVWLYSLVGRQNAQDILLPYLAIAPILFVCAFVPSDIVQYSSRFLKRKSEKSGC